MATVTKEIVIDAPAADVWSALRDFGALHQRLASGFVVDTRLDGDSRVVTFFNGAVAHERLVSIDDTTRRLVYTVVDSPLPATHDNSSAVVVADGAARTRFIWTKDVLPHDLAAPLAGLMDRGLAAIKTTLESSTREAESSPDLVA